MNENYQPFLDSLARLRTGPSPCANCAVNKGLHATEMLMGTREGCPHCNNSGPKDLAAFCFQFADFLEENGDERHAVVRPVPYQCAEFTGFDWPYVNPQKKVRPVLLREAALVIARLFEVPPRDDT